MRNAFVEELVRLAHLHKQIALIVGDLGYSVIEPFADQFPERFFNAGVAEQNMTGLAAGLASEGYHVFTYSIANFPTFRCAEQIRNDVDYHRFPVTVVAVGGGLAYGALGYSHHAVQDYALMRTMPNMLIAAPGDPMEVKACLNYLVENPQPSYLRLGKTGEKAFHPAPPRVSPGEWLRIQAGDLQNDESIVCTGAALQIAMESSAQIEGPKPSVYSVPLWGMQSKPSQEKWLRSANRITTLEDHLEDGGFGSWMLEAHSSVEPPRASLMIKALDKVVCGLVGSQTTLNRLGGLHSGPEKIK